MKHVHRPMWMNLPECTHFQQRSTKMITVNLEDIPYGSTIATASYLDSPNMTVTITWLLIDGFTIVILDMDSALHVEYSDVVLCGVFAVIRNYLMDGPATISNSMSLLRNLNYKQTHQIMPIWNGFHPIVLMIGEIMRHICMVYLLLNMQLLN